MYLGHWHESDIETTEGVQWLESLLEVNELEEARKARNLARDLLDPNLLPSAVNETRRQLYDALYELDETVNPTKRKPYLMAKNNPYE